MLAIVIPYFKLQFFEETLQSLADQTNKDFTVYIGDDASSQDCRPLLKQFEGKFSFVYKRFETNLGSTSLTQQWHRCIDLIADDTIQWVMLLGDDDYMSSNFVAAFYNNKNEIVHNNFNVIRFATQSFAENVFSKSYYNPKIEKSTDFVLKKLKGETRSSLSEYIFNKKQLVKIRFKNLPLAWHSDELAILEVSNFDTIYSVNEATIYVRISDVSISGNQNNTDEKDKASKLFLLLLIQNYSHFFSKGQKSELVSVLSRIYFKNQELSLFIKIVFFQLKYNSVKAAFLFIKKQIKRFL